MCWRKRVMVSCNVCWSVSWTGRRAVGPCIRNPPISLTGGYCKQRTYLCIRHVSICDLLRLPSPFCVGAMRQNQFPYGGQAVMEGVMMRGLRQATVAVRAPDGRIVFQDRPLNLARRLLWARVPILRGIQMLGDALIIGIWALSFSANTAAGEEDEQLSSAQLTGIIAVSLAMAIGLFFVLPLVLASLVAHLGLSNLWREAVEGGLRLLIFVGFLLCTTTAPSYGASSRPRC